MGPPPRRTPPQWRWFLPRRRRGWLWAALSIGIVLNGLRLRQRLSALSRIRATGSAPLEGDDDDFLVVHLPEVVVDDDTRRDAIAHARAQGLEVLDLVPGDLPFDPSLDLARGVDTRGYRNAPFATGRSALHALVVAREVWRRAFPVGSDTSAHAGPPGQVHDRGDMVRLTERLKQYAARSTDLAIAPRLAAVATSSEERLAELDATYGAFAPAAVWIPAARSSLLVAGLAISPGWGAAAMAGYAVQPYLVTAGLRLDRRSPSSRGRLLGRLVQPFALLRAALGRSRAAAGASPEDGDPIEARRPVYSAALQGGLEQFFEPRRQTCPWCGGADLFERLRTEDLFQFKPGQFVVDQCARCGVRFQNPRLSLAGLDFYYGDFYDGLGAGGMQFMFAQSEPFYRARVDLARRHVTAKRWLDVGTGYGHFCLVAQGFLPGTRFDGLDMGTSIGEGERRRWIDHGYHGLFPELAEEMRGRYDVVSMLHYLEHTRDPRAELDAARTALAPAGHLLIEVPDPESRFSEILGRYWVPWLQPQHQQFLPLANLCSALEERGFSVVEFERCPTNPTLDVAGALWTWASSMAPPPRRPWGDDPTAVERIRRGAIFGSVAPLALAGVVLDQVLQPFLRGTAEPWSDAYRVLARRN